jgi:hypothetical protein
MLSLKWMALIYGTILGPSVAMETDYRLAE